MSTINYLEGYAFAKKKGDRIDVFEGPHTLADFMPVIAEGTDVPRMLKDRFSDVVNVKDFGAKGDGIHDDTEAIQAALDTGRDVFIPRGTYVCTDELTLIHTGQSVFGSSQGGGYTANGSSAYLNWVYGSTLLFKNPKNPGVRYVKTRYLYRSSSNSPNDPAMSACINVQAEHVHFQSFSIILDIENVPSDPLTDSIDNLGADWDIGIFVGCRTHFTMTDCAVLGYHRKANIWIDVTHASNLSRFKDYRTGETFPNGTSGASGADGCELTNVLTYGGLWGLRVQGAQPENGKTGYDGQYYDELSGTTVPDHRGTFGFSDFAVVNCSIYGPDHHTRARIVDFPYDQLIVNHEGQVTQFPDVAKNVECGGAMSVSGLAGNSSGRLQGHRYISTRFSTWGPFVVRLDFSHRDLFIGCHAESHGSARYNHDGSLIGERSNQNSFGNFATTANTIRTRVIASALSYYDAYNNIKSLDAYFGNDFSGTSFVQAPFQVGGGVGSSPSGSSQIRIISGESGHSGIIFGTNENEFESSIRYYPNSRRLYIRIPDPNKETKSIRHGFTTSSSYEVSGQTDGVNIHLGFNAFNFGSFGEDGLAPISFYSTGNIYTKGNLLPRVDNARKIGSAEARWSEVFASTGTINTSDSRCKSSVASASDTLLDAVGAIPIHTFQFTDAVEKKGTDAARFHVGVIAQEVASAFEAKGLDAARYGLFCHDEWQDEYETIEVVDQPEVLGEDGEVVTPAVTHTEQKKILSAGDRYGIRYEELLVLECARLRRELDRIKAALTASGITV